VTEAMKPWYDWLTERVKRAERAAFELGAIFEWSQEVSASDDQIRECREELQRVKIALSSGHEGFLRIANGARLVWGAVNDDGSIRVANTITIFSTAQLCVAARGIYFPDPSFPNPEWMAQDFWEPTLPCMDLQDGNYLAIDPRIMTNGEYAIVWAESELGALYGDGISFVMPSFETTLSQMLDMIGLRREIPEFWEARSESLRSGWRAPDNWHWTNFPMAPRYRSDPSS
jgi:hypothetical protein